MTETSLKSYLVSRDHNQSTVVEEYKVVVEVISFWKKNHLWIQFLMECDVLPSLWKSLELVWLLGLDTYICKRKSNLAEGIFYLMNEMW